MEVDAVIADLFDLPDCSKLLQDEASCYSVVKYLKKFCNSGHSWFSQAECDAFQIAIEKLNESKPGDKIDWLPEYGCAVKKSTDRCMPGDVALNLIYF